MIGQERFRDKKLITSLAYKSGMKEGLILHFLKTK
jgi:hypothetical protein